MKKYPPMIGDYRKSRRVYERVDTTDKLLNLVSSEDMVKIILAYNLFYKNVNRLSNKVIKQLKELGFVRRYTYIPILRKQIIISYYGEENEYYLNFGSAKVNSSYTTYELRIRVSKDCESLLTFKYEALVRKLLANETNKNNKISRVKPSRMLRVAFPSLN